MSDGTIDREDACYRQACSVCCGAVDIEVEAETEHIG